MLVTNILEVSKSERTKAHLQDTALRLFAEHGFDGVTVDQIAEAAGTSHMTFFRHFPTKESVVLDDPYDPMIGHAVAIQDPDLPPQERVRMGMLSVVEHMDEDDRTIASRIRLAAEHSSLRARIWENNQRTESVIIDALAESGVPTLEAAVAAGSILGAITAALITWAREDAPAPLSDYLTLALNQLAAAPAQVSS